MTSAVLALVSAVQANTDAVNAAVAAIEAGSTGGVDPTDAPAIAAAVTQITANTDAITAALGGVVTPPVPPPTGQPLTAAQRQAALNAK